MPPKAITAAGLSVEAEITCGSRSQRSSRGASSTVAGRRLTSDMASRPVAGALPSARAVDLHLGVNLGGKIAAGQRYQPVQQDRHIRRLASNAGPVVGPDRELEFIEFATRPGDQRSEILHLAERLIAPG